MFDWSDEILEKHNIVQITPSLYDLLIYGPSVLSYGQLSTKKPTFILFVKDRKTQSKSGSEMMESFRLLWQMRKDYKEKIEVAFVDIEEHVYLKETFDVRREFEMRLVNGEAIYEFVPGLVWNIKEKYAPDPKDPPFDEQSEAKNF